jgi:hypothetical protein
MRIVPGCGLSDKDSADRLTGAYASGHAPTKDFSPTRIASPDRVWLAMDGKYLVCIYEYFVFGCTPNRQITICQKLKCKVGDHTPRFEHGVMWEVEHVRASPLSSQSA